MAYYIRVFGAQAPEIRIDHLNKCLSSEGFEARCKTLEDSDSEWIQGLIFNGDNTEIALLEHNKVVPDSIGSEELQEFIEEITDCKPASAVEWLLNFLPDVSVIYAIQILNGVEHDDGWAVIETICEYLLSATSGILQSDGEGFTNLDRFHILWQFSEDATGPWNMAVLKGGEWISFQMDLGDPGQRTAFLNGEVPADAELQ